MARSPEVSVIIRAKDLASKVVQGFERNMKAVKRVALDAAKGVAAITAAGAAAVATLGALADRGGKVIQVQAAFNRTVGDGPAALNKLREASRGLITDYELMVGMNRAAALGTAKTAEEFAVLIRAADRLAQVMGIEGGAAEALDKLNMGIGRQSALILDDLGLKVSATAANERYAASIGVQVSALTDAQKAEAFRSEALRQATALLEEHGEAATTAGDHVGRATTAFKNMKDELAKTIAESPAVNEFFGKLADLGTDIVAALNSDTPRVMAVLRELGHVAGNAFSVAFLATFRAVLDTIDKALLPKAMEAHVATVFGTASQVLRESQDLAGANIEASLGRIAAHAESNRIRQASHALVRSRTLAAAGVASPTSGGGSGVGSTAIEPFEFTAASLGAIRERIDDARKALDQARLDARIAAPGEEADKAREKIDELAASIERLESLREQNVAALPGILAALPDITGNQNRQSLGGLVARDEYLMSLSRGLPITYDHDRNGRVSTIGIAGRSDRWNEGVRRLNALGDEGAKEFSEAANVAISSLGAMASAAVAGTAQMEQVVVSGFTNILRSLDFAKAGPWGAIIGAVGGIVGGLFGRRDSGPIPVRLQDIDERAAAKMQGAQGPQNVTVQVVSPITGEVLSEVETALRRRQNRDAVQRIPRGVGL